LSVAEGGFLKVVLLRGPVINCFRADFISAMCPEKNEKSLTDKSSETD
jgi:hypothetical protein